MKGIESDLSAPALFCLTIGRTSFVDPCNSLLAYWLGEKIAESQIAELKSKVEVLQKRFASAKERTDVSTKEVTESNIELERLKDQLVAKRQH